MVVVSIILLSYGDSFECSQWGIQKAARGPPLHIHIYGMV